jgi:septum formation protein
MSHNLKLVLASSSPRRLKLLESVNIVPDLIIAPEIDETPLKAEKPEFYAKRIAKEKAVEASFAVNFDAIILAADTVVATKAKIFTKAESQQQVENFLHFYSGRRIKVHTAIAAIKIIDNCITKQATKLVTSDLKFKRLSKQDIEEYLNSVEGVGKAGGFAIQGFGEALLDSISGSYSGIIGLPINQTLKLLRGL